MVEINLLPGVAKMEMPVKQGFRPELDNVIERQLKLAEFEGEVTSLINSLSIENTCNTPDFIIGKFLRESLESFIVSTVERSTWYGNV